MGNANVFIYVSVMWGTVGLEDRLEWVIKFSREFKRKKHAANIHPLIGNMVRLADVSRCQVILDGVSRYTRNTPK